MEGRAMTEAEWATSSETWQMLQVVRGSASRRKARLLTASMCRLLWELLPEGSRAVVEDSERLADALLATCGKELCAQANRLVPPYGTDGKSDLHREAAVAVCYSVL